MNKFEIICENETDIRALLSTFISNCKTKYKMEKSRKGEKNSRVNKFCSPDGEPLFPYNIRVKYIDSDNVQNETMLNYDFDLDVFSKKRNNNDEPYILHKDRIPGNVYFGKVWYPKKYKRSSIKNNKKEKNDE